MSVDIDIEIDDSRARLKLAAMDARSKSFVSVFNWARRELERANAANFAANGLPSGKAWAPLDPEYGSWKASRFPGRSTLVRTGTLFRSLTQMLGAPNVITNDRATFGTKVEYAKFHQNGTFKMPKRQILFEPPLFAQRLARRAAEHVVDGEI